MKLIASDPSKENELVTKHKDWNQISILILLGATINRVKINTFT